MRRVKGCNHKAEKSLGTRGNPYEGGTCFFKCEVCGIVRASSEDGTEYYPKDYVPYTTSIADDLRADGIDPNTASDDTIIRWMEGS